MNIEAKIVISRRKVPENVFLQLLKLYEHHEPEDERVLVYEGTMDDPVVAGMLQMLEENGLIVRNGGAGPTRIPDAADDQIDIGFNRRYSDQELEAMSYLQLHQTWTDQFGDKYGWDAQGRARVVARKLPKGVDMTIGQTAVLVPERVKRALEPTDLVGIAWRQTVTHSGSDDTEWSDYGGEPWWELTSGVTMPRLSPSMKLGNFRGEPVPHGEYSERLSVWEGLYDLKELRYRAEDMAQMPYFDIAKVYEPLYTSPDNPARPLIASQKFYRTWKDLGLKAQWNPVRIEA